MHKPPEQTISLNSINGLKYQNTISKNTPTICNVLGMIAVTKKKNFISFFSLAVSWSLAKASSWP